MATSQQGQKPPLFSFAILTDTHLTVDAAFAEGGEAAKSRLTELCKGVVNRVNAMDPAFVVHLGDMGDPVPTSSKYDASAQVFRDVSGLFSAPFHVVPGNHDIGEKIHKALPHSDDNVSITATSIAQYEKTYGPSHYSFEHEDCLFMAINALLFNAGDDAEEKQWTWLSDTLVQNAGKRSFVFSHYPIYLAARDEPDFYDNIEEPARTRLIDLLQKHQVEGYFAGHVHNFFYNYLDGLHQTVLPSAGILRSDYMELFRASPTRNMGAFDPAKLGFLWIDVYADRHIPHFVRSSEKLPYRTHSRNSGGASVTMDLRLPWCEKTDIPCAWGLEIFERKEIRNDYPLAALWEMGVTDLRIPISDLLKPHISQRVKQLIALGHRFTVVSFGLPNATRRAALADHASGIKAIEVVAFLDQWAGFAPALKELGQGGDFGVYLTAVRPEVEGWTTHHGLHPDLGDEIKWVRAQTALQDAVDGFVFGIRRDVPPLDGFEAVRTCLADTKFKPLIHVPCVGMFWSTKYNETLSESAEISRMIEAAFIARSYPETPFVIDNFVELDRGYCGCQGLVDRFYNPKDGSRVLTGLDALLPERLTHVTCFETAAGRTLLGDYDGGHVVLLCDSASPDRAAPADVFDKDMLRQQGWFVDLTIGEEDTASLEDVLAARRRAEKPQPPGLLFIPCGDPKPSKYRQSFDKTRVQTIE